MSAATVPREHAEAYQQSVEEILAAFGTDARHGLSAAEARARLNRYGKNELTAEQPVPAWKKFLAQFHDVLVILLLIATMISAGLWLYERDSPLPYEALAIFAVVLLNAVLGYIQETRAEHAVAALRQMSAAHANVIRDGARQSIPATEAVPGDIILIEEGDTIPADARLIRSAALQTAEAVLTGESLPVSKDTAPITEEVGLGDRNNMVFSGTAATYGHGRAVVTATGMQTQMGRIAGMLKDAPTETTPLQKELDRVGKLLGIVVVMIAVVMITTIIVVEEVRGFSAIFDVLLLGVALAVAAVPEGLPTVVTAVLSLGVQRMATRNAIVRHLAAVETLGSANVIASDKTGTLTKNEMTIRAVVTASGCVRLGGTGYAPEGEVWRDEGGAIDGALRFELTRTLTAADRANNAVLQERDGRWTVQGDPTEGALITAARKAGLEGEALDARFARVAEVPFSSERKLMSTIHSDAERQERLLALTKGAPDILLARCSHELIGEATKSVNKAIMPNLTPSRFFAIANRMMTLKKLEAQFSSEDACMEYIVQLRWPHGARCPRCESEKVHKLSRPWKWQCKQCTKSGYRFSPLVGTVFENTNVPLCTWFRVIFLMTQSKKGVSALQVQRMIGKQQEGKGQPGGPGSYRTAWYICHRIRSAMKNGSFFSAPRRGRS